MREGKKLEKRMATPRKMMNNTNKARFIKITQKNQSRQLCSTQTIPDK